jgi:ABC-type cobalamin transport system ATPase subunit
MNSMERKRSMKTASTRMSRLVAASMALVFAGVTFAVITAAHHKAHAAASLTPIHRYSSVIHGSARIVPDPSGQPWRLVMLAAGPNRVQPDINPQPLPPRGGEE